MNKISHIAPKLNPVSRIRSIIRLSKDVDIIRTIYWNFRFFPFEIARKAPLFLGYNVDIINAKGGKICINSDEIQRGMIKIGITPFPTFPSKGLRSMIRFQGNSTITFGKDVSLMKGCSLVATYGGKITFGNDILINQHLLIYCNSSIEICNHVRIGWRVQIYDTPVHCVIDTATGEIKAPNKSVLISDNTWIGNHATISAGAQIPPFTIVASHSLVNKDFMQSPGSVIGGMLSGTPAKYRSTGKVRLVNDSIEGLLKTKFFGENKRSSANVSELGYVSSPLNGDENILYRSK